MSIKNLLMNIVPAAKANNIGINDSNKCANIAANIPKAGSTSAARCK